MDDDYMKSWYIVTPDNDKMPATLDNIRKVVKRYS